MDDLTLEPVKVRKLNITLLIEEYIFVLNIDVATFHIFWELPLQQLTFIILVVDGLLNWRIIGRSIQRDTYNIDYLGLSPVAY